MSAWIAWTLGVLAGGWLLRQKRAPQPVPVPVPVTPPRGRRRP